MISTNGLTISQHFCCGELVDAAVLYQVEKCKSESTPSSCCQKKVVAKKEESCSLKKDNNCCDYKTIFLQADDNVKTAPNDYSEFNLTFVAIFFIQNLQFQETLPHFSPKYFNYKPPLITQDDIEVLFQSFLC